MITIEKINNVNLRITSDDYGCLQELGDFFTFEVPGYKFMPSYRSGQFDGKIRMYDLHRKTLYVGLLKYVHDFAERNSYKVNYINEEVRPIVTHQEVLDYANWLKPSSRGEPITIRDYQVDAVHKALSDERVLLLSPTASGKSFIIYTAMRHHIEQNRKCIIIVPTVSLVHQMVSDFKDYSSANKWNADENIGMIMAGYDKTPTTKTIKFTMDDGSIRKYKLHDKVQTQRGKIFAKDITYEDEIV